VHGNGGRKEQWAPQLAHLRTTRQAAALDLRGFGCSQPPEDRNYSLQGFVDDVEAVTAELGLGRAVLVGHSIGGAVASLYATRHPESVAGLVLADTGGDTTRIADAERAAIRDGLRPERYREFTRTWFENLLRGARAEVRAEVLASLRATPREAFAGAALSVLDFNPARAVESFTGPKLAVFVPWLNNRPHSLHNLMPDLPRQQMTGVSHWLMLDRPEEFNAILDEFLSVVDRGD